MLGRGVAKPTSDETRLDTVCEGVNHPQILVTEQRYIVAVHDSEPVSHCPQSESELIKLRIHFLRVEARSFIEHCSGHGLIVADRAGRVKGSESSSVSNPLARYLSMTSLISPCLGQTSFGEENQQRPTLLPSPVRSMIAQL